MITTKENPMMPVAASGEGKRSVLRRSVSINVAQGSKVLASTLAVSASGLTVMSPRPFRKGVLCDIVFDLPCDGRLNTVQATSRTGDCVCVGVVGFRTNLQFVKINDAGRALIRHWIQGQV